MIEYLIVETDEAGRWLLVKLVAGMGATLVDEGKLAWVSHLKALMEGLEQGRGEGAAEAVGSFATAFPDSPFPDSPFQDSASQDGPFSDRDSQDRAFLDRVSVHTELTESALLDTFTLSATQLSGSAFSIGSESSARLTESRRRGMSFGRLRSRNPHRGSALLRRAGGSRR
jgi:hypothetical protein